MYAPRRPNTHKLALPTSRRRSVNHRDDRFCNDTCATCDDRMSKRSRSLQAGVVADGFAARGTRRWYEAHDAAMHAK